MPAVPLKERIAGLLRPAAGMGRTVGSAQYEHAASTLSGPADSKQQPIRLTRVKTALGQHWPQYADSVLHAALSVVARRVLPGDVYEVVGDDAILVRFARPSAQEAHNKAQALTKEIEDLLIKPTPAGAPVHAMAMPLQAFHDPIVGCEPDEETIVPPFSLPMQQNAEAANGPDELSRPAPAEEDEEKADGENWHAQAGAGFSAHGEQEEKAQKPGADPGQGRKRYPRLIPGVDWYYRPVWDFENSALLQFALLPKFAHETGQNDGASPHLPAWVRPTEIDVAAILTATHDLVELSQSDRRLPLVIEIHLETIVDERRQAYIVEALKKIPAQFFQQLIFEIVGAVPGEHVLPLSGFIARLSTMRIKAAIRLEPAWPSGPGFSTCGAAIVTMKFPPGWSEVAQMDVLDAMAKRAKLAQVDCALWDIATRSMAVAAASSGVRYLSGPAIAADAQTLSHALRYSPMDLYNLQTLRG